MRAEVLRTIEDLAARDDRIVFLTGDLGFGVVESFFQRFPERAINAGVAEQNMIAMATGLAEAGMIPFVYSIATFAVLRPFEFIRNGPVIHHLPVRIVGVGGGLEYSNNGPTHFALEDVGVLRTLPGLQIICPNDSPQACSAVASTYLDPGPIYYRLGKSAVAPAAGMDGEWNPSGAVEVARGDGSVALVALGPMASVLDGVRGRLEALGVNATVVAVSRVSPPPAALVSDLANRHRLIATIENHNVVGGLGSLVCEIVAECGTPTTVLRIGTREWPNVVVGSASHLQRWAGLDEESIVDSIHRAWSRLDPTGERTPS